MAFGNARGTAAAAVVGRKDSSGVLGERQIHTVRTAAGQETDAKPRVTQSRSSANSSPAAIPIFWIALLAPPPTPRGKNEDQLAKSRRWRLEKFTRRYGTAVCTRQGTSREASRARGVGNPIAQEAAGTTCMRTRRAGKPGEYNTVRQRLRHKTTFQRFICCCTFWSYVYRKEARERALYLQQRSPGGQTVWQLEGHGNTDMLTCHG